MVNRKPSVSWALSTELPAQVIPDINSKSHYRSNRSGPQDINQASLFDLLYTSWSQTSLTGAGPPLPLPIFPKLYSFYPEGTSISSLSTTHSLQSLYPHTPNLKKRRRESWSRVYDKYALNTPNLNQSHQTPLCLQYLRSKAELIPFSLPSEDQQQLAVFLEALFLSTTSNLTWCPQISTGKKNNLKTMTQLRKTTLQVEGQRLSLT